jgi:Tol biopolymer transport system component
MGNIYTVSAEGGPVQELLPRNQHSQTPSWSHDGESIVYSVARDGHEDLEGLFILDLKSRKSSKVPGSESKRDPVLSFDGRYLLAVDDEDPSAVVVYDFHTQVWKTVARSKNFYRIRPTNDGKYFYFQDLLSAGEPIFRMHVGDWKVERVLSFESMLKGDVVRCRFAGIMQDGSPMVIAVRGGYEIYSIDLDLP